MKSSFALLVGFISCAAVEAGNVSESFPRHPEEKSWLSDGAFRVRSIQGQESRVLKSDAEFIAPAGSKDNSGRSSTRPVERFNPTARAWKKGWIEEGVEESRKVLIECQNASSVVLTTPFMRSDSQQNHCYRF